MASSDRKELINRYIDAYNAFDIDGMVALLSPAVRFENFSGGQLTAEANGIDEFRQLAEHGKALFAEREQRIVSIESDSDSTIVDITYRGILAKDIPNGPLAGTVLELQGKSEFRFSGGKISKIVDCS